MLESRASDFDEQNVVSGTARAVFMSIGHLSERVAVAIVGQLIDGTPFARAVSSKVLRALPNDLGFACFHFGSIVAADFLGAGRRRNDVSAWESPLQGLEIGSPFDVDGFDLDSIAEAAARLCAFYQDPSSDPEEQERVVPPRASEEARFLESVREEVIRRQPRLRAGFKRTFSLTGGHASSEIDYVGSRYATCYAAINPRARQGIRVTTASAALWRLARARDAFGFAAPMTMELTAWVPSEGLPIYSSDDYTLVKETVAELTEQARREDLGVQAANDATQAARHLIDLEASQSQV
ncbi:MAG TPA: hypothetical protein VMK05_16745 [Burkholderiales bacterium]|nr:hypothetical protein [Burkholderiales bacterium]